MNQFKAPKMLAAAALALMLSTSAFAAEMKMSDDTQPSAAAQSESQMQTSTAPSESQMGTNDTMSSDSQASDASASGSTAANDQVSLVFQNNPVKTGVNSFTVTLKDSDGQPVTGAEITATFDMDKSDMDSMNMSEPVKVSLTEKGKGEYTGGVSLSDAGKWVMNANVKVGDATFEQKQEFTVQSAGPNMMIIGGFVGVIVLIMVVAFVAKKKNATRR